MLLPYTTGLHKMLLMYTGRTLYILLLYRRGMLYILLLYHAALGVAEPEVRHRLLLAQVPAATVDNLCKKERCEGEYSKRERRRDGGAMRSEGGE